MLTAGRALSLESDNSGRYVPLLVAVMVYLAALALAAALGMNKVVARWDSGLSGQMTVQVLPDEAGALDPARLESLVHMLQATPGVSSAEVLSADKMAALLSPWLGADMSLADLPLPALIAVEVSRSAPPDLVSLNTRLQAADPGASLDDHKAWLGRLVDLARSVELVAFVILGLVGLSAIFMVTFVTRMGLAIHAPIIELLHLIGAQDAYIARQFQRHAMRLALKGSILGCVLALATVLLLAHFIAGVGGGLIPEVGLNRWEWVMIAALPFLAIAISVTTARKTVLRALAKMP